MEKSSRWLKHNWYRCASAYTPLFWAGLVGMYLKFSLMEGYWPGIARLLDQKTVPAFLAFSYFSLDILVNFFLIPGFVVAMALLLFQKRAPVFTTIVSCLLIVFYFVQLRAQQDTGQYLSVAMMSEAARFAVSEPHLASSYIPASAIAKLFIALLVTVLGTVLISFASETLRVLAIIRAGMGTIAVVLVFLAAGAVFAYPNNSVGLHRSSVQKILAAMSSHTLVWGGASNKNLDPHLSAFRELTATPDRITGSVPLGKEANSNVLYFILETGPAEVFPDADATDLLPTELIQHALTATRHYTTYPYTSDATYSILTGFYPDGRRELVERGGFKTHKVLFAQLRDKGYQTGAYVQAVTDANVDEKMLRQFGVNTVFVANRHLLASPELQRATAAASNLGDRVLAGSPYFEPARKQWMLDLLRNDLHALEKMKTDMRSTLRARGKFAHIFLPQIGHGPWLHIGTSANRHAYGRELMKMQSLWLKDVVQLLQDEGALKNTVIVLTSDHGVRTKVEDPDFKVGTISSYSFHVPLFVFAPSAFAEPIAIRTATSHIDIESSVSLLMGVQSGMGVTEGAPLWDGLENRRLYFFAGNYGGADGFFQRDFFMSNAITETQFQSPSMDFSAPGREVKSVYMQEFVTKALSDFTRLHRGIIFAL